MKNKTKYLLTAVLLIVFFAGLTVCSYASEENMEDAIEENIFSSAYNEILEYSAEIMCALTLAGSVILAIAYKKGLLPILKSSLLSIGNSMGKIKESVKENTEKSSMLGESVEKGLENSKLALDELARRIEALDLALEKKLAADGCIENERRQMRIIINSQIDMLYEIFMTSALPQYQKDAVGEKISKMRGELNDNADGN